MSDAPHLRDLVAARLSRRTVLGALAAAPLLSLDDAFALPAGAAPAFTPVAATAADTVTVPAGYAACTLIAWGDALYEGMAPFDPDALTRADQEKRFGQNNDMLALFPASYAFPWPRDQKHHILCANNEYVEPALTFPALTKLRDFTPAHTAALYAAIGVSIVQTETGADGVWRPVRDAAPGGVNRRITPFTPMAFDGPAATHRWIAAGAGAFNAAENNTAPDTVACGTGANCAGGQTPWGTYLTCEENFDALFGLSDPNATALGPAQADAAWLWSSGDLYTPLFNRAGNPTAPAQFDAAKNPYGPALYGWVVEIDPHDPSWTPRKHTGLGRFKHECAVTALTRDGRVAVYSGDDQVDQCVYKFVSAGRFDPANRTANRDLLSEGQLFVAKFNADGTGEWLALTAARANAVAAGYTAPFADDGDVAIRAREAAKLMGATPMDRPEDIDAIRDENWVGLGPVLVVCTNNRNERHGRPGNPDRAGPPGPQVNLAGHIIRIDEAGADCAASRFRWNVFVLAGDPAAVTVTTPAGAEARVSVAVNRQPTFTGDRFACPDNICVDTAMNVWIATDGSDAVFGDCNDAVLVTPLTARGPRPVKRFLVGPMGAEICGPTIAPDERAFLCAIQHPGENDAAGTTIGDLRWRLGKAPPSTFPDGGWPRSAVVVVTKTDGGKVGT